MIDVLIFTAKQAGENILNYYGNAEYEDKDDGSFTSPLTQADLAAHATIVKALKTSFPNVPIISEEDVPSYDERKNWQEFFLVDPLDGTKEFLKQTGEFTVNIAYISPKKQVAVVYAPATEDCWYSDGEKSYKNGQEIKVSEDASPLRVVASKSHFSEETKDYVERLGKPYELLQYGSSLKICAVADGSADIYPRLGPTMEWDTAAAHIILEHAGGDIVDLEGKPLEYNKEDLHNPFFIAKKK